MKLLKWLGPIMMLGILLSGCGVAEPTSESTGAVSSRAGHHPIVRPDSCGGQYGGCLGRCAGTGGGADCACDCRNTFCACDGRCRAIVCAGRQPLTTGTEIDEVITPAAPTE
jgi:hypothetical protein